MPKVSVIIPTYNRAHFIAEAIQSVLDQTFTDFEIIVVDDGSTDNTKDVVEGFNDSRIRYIYQENRGVAAARNTSIKASSGEYIAFLDSDDMWLPENLKLKVELLDSHPDIALVSSDYYFFDSNTGANKGRYWAKKPYRHLIELPEGTRQPVAFATLLNPVVVIVRRQVIVDEVGYFDESLRYSEDWDMWIRILPRFPIKIINLPLARYRQHPDQLTTGIPTKNYLAELAMLNKVIHGDAFSKADKAFARKRSAHTHFHYGFDKLTEGNTTLAREKLLTSIKINPWQAKPYVYLPLTLLGRKGFLTLNRWRKAVKSRFT